MVPQKVTTDLEPEEWGLFSIIIVMLGAAITGVLMIASFYGVYIILFQNKSTPSAIESVGLAILATALAGVLLLLVKPSSNGKSANQTLRVSKKRLQSAKILGYYLIVSAMAFALFATLSPFLAVIIEGHRFFPDSPFGNFGDFIAKWCAIISLFIGTITLVAPLTFGPFLFLADFASKRRNNNCCWVAGSLIKFPKLIRLRRRKLETEVRPSVTKTEQASERHSYGHNYPFRERGMAEADLSAYVFVSFNIPSCLYLDSNNVGGITLKSGKTLLDFKHIVNPHGRCGMPIQLTGGEIIDDDMGNYTYTSVSACIPYDKTWKASEYILEAIRAINEVIVAYREVANKPTIATLGFNDLSHGVVIEGPFSDTEKTIKGSGISGTYVMGVRGDGSPVFSIKGFAGGWHQLQPTLDTAQFTEIQLYLDGVKGVTVARRFLQEAFRELRHGDYSFAIVIAGGSLEIGAQELCDRKCWSPGSSGSFGCKFFITPFVVNGHPGFDQVDPKSFDLVEKLYRTRNKVIHEGKPYYLDNSIVPATTIHVNLGDASIMIEAVRNAINWLEGYP